MPSSPLRATILQIGPPPQLLFYAMRHESHTHTTGRRRRRRPASTLHRSVPADGWWWWWETRVRHRASFVYHDSSSTWIHLHKSQQLARNESKSERTNERRDREISSNHKGMEECGCYIIALAAFRLMWIKCILQRDIRKINQVSRQRENSFCCLFRLENFDEWKTDLEKDGPAGQQLTLFVELGISSIINARERERSSWFSTNPSRPPSSVKVAGTTWFWQSKLKKKGKYEPAAWKKCDSLNERSESRLTRRQTLGTAPPPPPSTSSVYIHFPWIRNAFSLSAWLLNERVVSEITSSSSLSAFRVWETGLRVVV